MLLIPSHPQKSTKACLTQFIHLRPYQIRMPKEASLLTHIHKDGYKIDAIWT